jgi:NAD-dependent dihydropyrimidine dehydrogenase PreA subunit
MMRYASLFIAVCTLTLSACQGPADSTQLTVDPDRCIACGKCEEVCPYGAVEVIDGNAVIDPVLCHFCFRCVEICPEGAIY